MRTLSLIKKFIIHVSVLSIILMTAGCDEATLIMLQSLKLSQVFEMLSGIGRMGVLADGTGAETVRLPECVTIPTAKGEQPLTYKPLPPLPMPDHPYLLDEYASGGVHSDSYNSSTSPLPGPVGINPIATTTAVLPNDVAMATPLMRDLEGRLVSVCISLFKESHLVLFDPSDDFKILARTPLPKRNGFIDPAGGWYSRMDYLGRPVIPTPEQDIRVYEVIEDNGEYSWNIAEYWDLSGMLPENVGISDVVPDWYNNYWFQTGFGHVGYLNRSTGNTEITIIGGGDETASAALTVGPEGAYVITSKALYMMDVDEDDVPFVQWRWAYPTSDNVDLGTPTLIDNGNLIAISLNGIGDQSLLTVLKTSTETMDDADRVVCQMPMFKPGKSEIKNTMMGYGKSIVAENNIGGEFFEVGPFEPGLARVDVREDLSGCDCVWEDYTISSQVPPRLSIGDGHIYLYSHIRNQPWYVHAYYLTAIDFETGQVDSEVFVASGKRMDNPMLSVDFWPGGVMVGGVRNGIVTLRDN